MKFKPLILALFAAGTVFAGEKPSQQWLDQKYSMFIHFGLYSVYGGVYNGKPVERGYSEQIQSFAGIFSDWYAQTAERFDPVRWNPDSIVSLAKEAGMKSIVITSKHHDGFCMYRSRYTDFNIADATPYGRDLMKELSDACARGGIGFSVYFSLIDWHFPQASPISSHNADPIPPEHHRYNLQQVEEIMTGYGPISEIWFDMGSLTPGQSRELYQLVNRLQPGCMISGRLGNDYVDFAVMADNEYPDYKLDVPWQTAASIFDETWGYRSWQERGELSLKTDEKITHLIRVISRGGNFLLNIGPRGDGSVVEFERDLLLEMGRWIKANAEAIYGSRANPFDRPFEWGDATAKENALYLFVKREFEEKEIDLHGFSGKISGIVQLQTGQACTFRTAPNVRVRVPRFPDRYPYTVLKVSFEEPFSVLPAQAVEEKEWLTPENATHLFGHSSLNYYAGYKSLIGYDWTVKPNKKRSVPQLTFTASELGRKVQVEIDGKTQTATLTETNPRTERLPENSVKWGDLYRKAGRGVFGFIEEENAGFINPADSNSLWEKIEGFPYGDLQRLKLPPRGSVLLLQEIHSDSEREAAVEIGSGNGLYVLINGAYLTAHLSPERVEYAKEIVILPLKKGKNQLLVKLYNGFEKELQYSVNPLPAWTLYRQGLSPATSGGSGYRKVSVRDALPASRVAPLRLNNLRIKF